MNYKAYILTTFMVFFGCYVYVWICKPTIYLIHLIRETDFKYVLGKFIQKMCKCCFFS